MEVTLKPDLQTRSCTNPEIPGHITPTQYASVTRLSPAFRVRVWLHKTKRPHGIGLARRRSMCENIMRELKWSRSSPSEDRNKGTLHQKGVLKAKEKESDGYSHDTLLTLR